MSIGRRWRARAPACSGLMYAGVPSAMPVCVSASSTSVDRAGDAEVGHEAWPPASLA